MVPEKKIEKTLNNTHHTTQKRINNGFHNTNWETSDKIKKPRANEEGN